MKKLMFLLTGLLMAQSAYSVCTVALENRRTGMERQRFTEYGVRGCSEAMSDCERSRFSTRRPERFTCRVLNNRPIPPTPPTRNKCTYSIVELNRVVDTFTGRGFRACDEAERMCADALYRGQRTGQYRYFAKCKRTDIRNPLPPTDYQVTKRCEVQRRDRFGNLMGIHNATATGYSREPVLERACAEAQRSCEAQRYYSESCHRMGEVPNRPTPRPRGQVIRRR